MMKKTTAIFLATFYFLITIGVVINVHYCHGFVSEVSLFDEATCGCDDTGKACCHNETIVLIDQNDQKLVSTQVFNFNVDKIIVELESIQDNEHILPLILENKIEVQNESPPNAPPLWLLNCSFTFYG